MEIETRRKKVRVMRRALRERVAIASNYIEIIFIINIIIMNKI